jgi:hypothetical protein
VDVILLLWLFVKEYWKDWELVVAVLAVVAVLVMVVVVVVGHGEKAMAMELRFDDDDDNSGCSTVKVARRSTSIQLIQRTTARPEK